jgi:hypothetical protein
VLRTVVCDDLEIESIDIVNKARSAPNKFLLRNQTVDNRWFKRAIYSIHVIDMRTNLAGLEFGAGIRGIQFSVGCDEDVSRGGGVPVMILELILRSADLGSLAKGQCGSDSRCYPEGGGS